MDSLFNDRFGLFILGIIRDPQFRPAIDQRQCPCGSAEVFILDQASYPLVFEEVHEVMDYGDALRTVNPFHPEPL